MKAIYKDLAYNLNNAAFNTQYVPELTEEQKVFRYKVCEQMIEVTIRSFIINEGTANFNPVEFRKICLTTNIKEHLLLLYD